MPPLKVLKDRANLEQRKRLAGREAINSRVESSEPPYRGCSSSIVKNQKKTTLCVESEPSMWPPLSNAAFSAGAVKTTEHSLVGPADSMKPQALKNLKRPFQCELDFDSSDDDECIRRGRANIQARVARKDATDPKSSYGMETVPPQTVKPQQASVQTEASSVYGTNAKEVIKSKANVKMGPSLNKAGDEAIESTETESFFKQESSVETKPSVSANRAIKPTVTKEAPSSDEVTTPTLVRREMPQQHAKRGYDVDRLWMHSLSHESANQKVDYYERACRVDTGAATAGVVLQKNAGMGRTCEEKSWLDPDDREVDVYKKVASKLQSTPKLYPKLLMTMETYYRDGMSCNEIIKAVDGFTSFLKQYQREAGIAHLIPAKVLRLLEGVREERHGDTSFYFRAKNSKSTAAMPKNVKQGYDADPDQTQAITSATTSKPGAAFGLERSQDQIFKSNFKRPRVETRPSYCHGTDDVCVKNIPADLDFVAATASVATYLSTFLSSLTNAEVRHKLEEQNGKLCAILYCGDRALARLSVKVGSWSHKQFGFVQILDRSQFDSISLVRDLWIFADTVPMTYYTGTTRQTNLQFYLASLGSSVAMVAARLRGHVKQCGGKLHIKSWNDRWITTEDGKERLVNPAEAADSVGLHWNEKTQHFFLPNMVVSTDPPIYPRRASICEEDVLVDSSSKVRNKEESDSVPVSCADSNILVLQNVPTNMDLQLLLMRVTAYIETLIFLITKNSQLHNTFVGSEDDQLSGEIWLGTNIVATLRLVADRESDRCTGHGCLEFLDTTLVQPSTLITSRKPPFKYFGCDEKWHTAELRFVQSGSDQLL